jgi:putative glutamine transport system permease protein
MDYFGRGVIENLNLFWDGFLTTIWVSIFSASLSLLIGLVVACLRVTASGGLKILAIVYTEFFRNTPFLVQALALYFGLPKLGIQLQFSLFGLEFNQSFVVGTLALSLYTGAYVAETLRAGLLVIPAGQSEAARSLGLSAVQTLWYIVIPQALRLVIPPLSNLYSAMVKNSAILSSIALVDLMSRAAFVNNRIDRTFEVFTAVIVFYLILTLPLAWGVSYFEKKLNPHRASTLKLKGAR